MSSEESRKVSDQDIQLVQRYMTRKEVLNILFVQEKIEPAFTELVWQKFEQENQEFFKAYYLRLMLKEQIMGFNRLLGSQVVLMHHVVIAGVSFQPINGSHIPLTHQNLACYAPENMGPALKTENKLQPITPNIPNDFTNCGLLMPSSMQTAVKISAHSIGIDISQNMLLAQSSNVGMAQIPIWDFIITRCFNIFYIISMFPFLVHNFNTGIGSRILRLFLTFLPPLEDLFVIKFIS